MNYTDALSFINKTGKFGSKLGLLNIENLMHELGDPQDSLKFVHIAGTNGKGSTALFISEILRKSGLSVGLYTSPFIYEFNERIKVDGKNIPDEDFARIMDSVVLAIEKMTEKGMEHPTEFEIITASAFLYFYEKKCDVVVLEVGLGGRFDATNIIKTPVLSVITKIGIDHNEFLGNTIEKIAFEKCGIIKKGVPVISCPEQREGAISVIKDIAKKNESPLVIPNTDTLEIKKCDISGSTFIYKDMEITLKQIGYYQIFNAITAIESALYLSENGFNITKENIKDALKTAVWQGRMEIISNNPTVIIDGSHNADGIDAFIKTAKEVFGAKKPICLFSMLKDKDYDYALSRLSEVTDTLVLTEIDSPRKETVDNLYKKAEGRFLNIYKEAKNEDAVKKALSIANDTDSVVAIGSLYMLSSIKDAVLKNK